ncbi:hypothetical protein SAMN05444387_1287 [Flavobacterium pectinovorum]|uniref:Uncharacterized protein n=1 Tax=Flavobacterium pectinovorum TaxID=29533 RepID=A0ABY1J0J7_9FLAO|nr:hypothetical protein SAMN05444387_1287 [Flavobacterium pectinovorum]
MVADYTDLLCKDADSYGFYFNSKTSFVAWLSVRLSGVEPTQNDLANWTSTPLGLTIRLRSA